MAQIINLKPNHPEAISVVKELKWSIPNNNFPGKLAEETTNSLTFIKNGFKSSLVSYLSKTFNSDVFIDVGANYGQTLMEIFINNPRVKYYGFEPNIEAFNILKSINKSININSVIFPWACSHQNQPLKIFKKSDLDSSATLISEIRPDTYQTLKGEFIPSYTLSQTLGDELLPNFIMKIDVEGFENEVISGGLNIINQKRPAIICEVLHAHRNSEIELNNRRKTELEKILHKINYKIFKCIIDKKFLQILTGLELINQFPKNVLWKENYFSCDYLFIPNEINI